MNKYLDFIIEHLDNEGSTLTSPLEKITPSLSVNVYRDAFTLIKDQGIDESVPKLVAIRLKRYFQDLINWLAKGSE